VKLQFRTRTGSIYEIEGDKNGGTWKRIEKSVVSGDLRSTEGIYTSHSAIAIGHPVVLLCPNYVSGSGPRMVATSAVVKIIPNEGLEVLDESKMQESSGPVSSAPVGPGPELPPVPQNPQS
jgi:hypothetical protein